MASKPTYDPSSVWFQSSAPAADSNSSGEVGGTGTRDHTNELGGSLWTRFDGATTSSVWAKTNVELGTSTQIETGVLDQPKRNDTSPTLLDSGLSFVAARPESRILEKNPSPASPAHSLSTDSLTAEAGKEHLDNPSDTRSTTPPTLLEPSPTADNPAPAKPVLIGRFLMSSEIVAILSDHGCPDVTDLLDVSTSSTWPVSSGGFGDVYRLKLHDSTEVAIKTTRIEVNSVDEDTKHLKHVARELHTWSKCNHSNVVKLLGLAVFRGQIGMVSPWMQNGSLPSYLSRSPGADRCEISAQMSQGLTYLHANGIIHGDLKGMNVLVSDAGTPVLTDFGNSILADQSLRFTTTTSNASISLRWTAPELLDSEASSLCTKEADVYALGMTILETISGAVPYSGKSEQSVMFCVWQGKLPSRPPEIHPRSKQGDLLWSLLTACWSTDMKQRPSAAEVAETLKAITTDGLRHDASSTP